jgi:hypothetical protein
MNSLLRFSLIITFSLSALSCDKCQALKNDDCICTLQYDPVCGCDKETYGNACQASCADVEYTEGACK